MPGIEPASRLTRLNGARIGLLDPGKRTAGAVLRAVGDRVGYGGRDLRWEYPRKELEAGIRPGGAGAWSSTFDGVAGFRSIELRAHTAPLGGDEFDESVEEAVPQVVSILTGGFA